LDLLVQQGQDHHSNHLAAVVAVVVKIITNQEGISHQTTNTHALKYGETKEEECYPAPSLVDDAPLPPSYDATI